MPPAAEASPRWLYALVLPGPSRGTLVAAGLPLAAARAHSLVAVHGPPPEGAELERLRTHQQVVTSLYRHFAMVLPFRFGIEVQSARSIGPALKAQAPLLRRALHGVKNRAQFALRLLGPATPSGDPVPSRRGGAAYLRARAERAKVSELDPVRAVVGHLVKEERTARPEQGPLRACVYHLVDREDAPAYLRAVRRAGFSNPSLELRISGPEPAWAFAPEVDAWR